MTSSQLDCGPTKIDRRAMASGPFLSKGRAENAFAVLDRWQHHGLATRMLRTLADVARQHEIHTFTAQMLGTNQAMNACLPRFRIPIRERLDKGVYDVTLSIVAA